MMAGLLIVNADDYGASPGATTGVVRAHRQGVVTSASLTAVGVDYANAVELARSECPNLGLGLHFTLSAGKPVSPPDRVPDLVDDSGHFRWEFSSLLAKVGMDRKHTLLNQIEIELESQIRKLQADGIKPDHINGERHVHLIPGIFELVVEAAERHGISFVRAGKDVTLEMVRWNNFKPAILQGGIIKYLLLGGLTYINKNKVGKVRTSDWFASYVYTGRLDLLLPKLLKSTREGVTEIMVHPGVPEKSRGLHLGNRGLEQYLVSDDRRLELEACIDARSHVTDERLRTFAALAGS